eukprot:2051446-Amphidinium_carterae.1
MLESPPLHREKPLTTSSQTTRRGRLGRTNYELPVTMDSTRVNIGERAQTPEQKAPTRSRRNTQETTKIKP